MGGSSNNPVVYYIAHYCFCVCMHGQNSICKFNQIPEGGGKDLHRGAFGPPEINLDMYTILTYIDCKHVGMEVCTD